jgi:hypothetical protein
MRSINPRKKQKIFERDKFKCCNCGISGDLKALEVDHILPICNGGSNDYSNLQTLCYKCNIDKRFGKKMEKDILKINTLEKLKLVKKRLEEYSELTYPEFKVVFTQDKLFKELRLDLLYLNDLFFEISGKRKGTETKINVKYKEQRNKLIKILRDITGKTLTELEEFLRENDLKISKSQIGKICNPPKYEESKEY